MGAFALTPEQTVLCRQMASLARLGGFIVDLTDGRCLWCSDEVARIHGRSVADCADLLSGAELEWVHPDDQGRYRAARDGGAYTLQYRLLGADGGRRLVNETAEPMTDPASGQRRLIGTVQDVTERERVEAALQQANQELERRVAARTAELRAAERAAKASQDRFLAAAEALMDGLAIYDGDDRLVFHNRRYPDHAPSGFRAVMKLGERFEDMIREACVAGGMYHPEMGNDFVDRRFADHRSPAEDREFRIADGRWVRVRESAIAGGGRVLLTNDITEQKRAQDALEEREQLLETIADGIPLPIVISRISQPEILFANELATETFGLRIGPQRDATGVAYLDPQDRKALIERLFADQRVDGFEVRLRRVDGTAMWALLSARAIMIGGQLAMLLTVTDITERKAALVELEEREERFRAIAEGVPLSVVISRMEPPEILYANALALETFGLRPGIGAAAIRGIYARPEDRERLLAQLKQDGRIDGFEVELRQRDGETMWCLLSARTVSFGGRPALLTALTDVTQLKATQQALEESEARLAAFLEHAPVGMYLKDLEGRYVMLNPETSRILGAAGNEMVGRTVADSPLDHDAAFVSARDLEVLRTGKAMVSEEHLPYPDGSAWMVIRFPVRDARGEITHIGGFDLDITERKRMDTELARQRQILNQNEKMSALGSLLAGVAHELNNPLSVVVGHASLLEDVAADEATRGRALKIRTAADRCARIVRTFLAMARSKPQQWGVVDLNATIEEALEIVAYGLRTADVAVVKRLAPDLPAVWADGDQLYQVLANLFVNAQQALQGVPPPRRLTVTSGFDDDAIWVEVADNGPGVPGEIADRIFEPFFTTKPQGVGTGVGLSVCHGIVSTHRGEIRLVPKAEAGALFRVRLPRSAIEDATDAAEPTDWRRRAARILVVDDEPEVGQLLTDILARDGHRVDRAKSGREALGHLSNREVDVIICDLRMPDMDGPALYRELAVQRPELLARIVFVTGDTLAADMTGFLTETGARVIEKPLDPQGVNDTVQALLARRPRRGEELTPAGSSDPRGGAAPPDTPAP